MKKGFRILKFKKDKPIFEIRDLSKSYDGRPILKKLSIKVFPGECVGILGPNGKGKLAFTIFFKMFKVFKKGTNGFKKVLIVPFR